MRYSNNDKGKEKALEDHHDDISDPDEIAMLQEKVAKFPPKIESLLPRMLNKGDTSITNASKSSKEQVTIGGNNNYHTTATTQKATTTKESTSKKTTSTSTKNLSVPTSKSKSRKSPSPSGTSIAALIPKGSRARPLPQIAQEPNTQDTNKEPESNTRVGDQPESAIILSSSLPSMSLNWDYRNSKSQEDQGSIDQEEPQLETKSGASKTATMGTMPSVMSIGSTKSIGNASMIPSIQLDRISDWMGGVKEAMQQDEAEEPANTTSRTAHAPTIPTEPTGNNRSKPVVVLKPEGPKITEESRKPILRRPPPGIPRHAQSITNTSPSPSPEVSTSSAVVVLSSLAEDDLLTTMEVDQQIRKVPGTSQHILIQDSLPSDLYSQELPEFPESNTTSKNPAAIDARENPGSRRQSYGKGDEVSTIVGQNLTQDQPSMPQSLPSFVYDDDENISKSEEEYYSRVRQGQEFKEPSLPSALTSSCLQELGLLKRKPTGEEGELRKRRLRGETNLDENEEEEGDSIMLAQMGAFPSSIGAAPSSLSFLPESLSLSQDVIESPEYSHALPERLRQTNENQPQSQLSTQNFEPEQNQQPRRSSVDGSKGTSFPSPPTQITFSTLPTMPSFPSQLQSEPSLILLGSQNPNQDNRNENGDL
ncbi:hypothetical protein BGZ76_001097 [Entomortierella beljakovae]|nr:hypothetical protein BGZ76_001097 [Entomortierella beljakovae]